MNPENAERKYGKSVGGELVALHEMIPSQNRFRKFFSNLLSDISTTVDDVIDSWLPKF